MKCNHTHTQSGKYTGSLRAIICWIPKDAGNRVEELGITLEGCIKVRKTRTSCSPHHVSVLELEMDNLWESIRQTECSITLLFITPCMLWCWMEKQWDSDGVNVSQVKLLTQRCWGVAALRHWDVEMLRHWGQVMKWFYQCGIKWKCCP